MEYVKIYKICESKIKIDEICRKYKIVNYTINGNNSVTDNEELILQFKVEGTYHTCIGYMEVDYNELNEEYQYLYNAEVENYCLAQKMRLVKLNTNCNYHA